MHKSYIVDPETGKLLAAQEWKDKAGDKVNTAKIVAIVPDDGSPAIAFPVEVFPSKKWEAAMELAKAYKAPHPIEGSDGTFNLPTRKQAIDFRIARESGLDQLLEMIGAGDCLDQFDSWGWTCERYVPRGTSEDRWSCVCISSSPAWFYGYYGMSLYYGFSHSFTVRPVTLLHLDLKPCGEVAEAQAAQSAE
jgi:hypothetical protein